MVARPHRPAAALHPAPEVEARAREYLEALGRGDHPDAATDPVYALYQVAVDFRCSAYGYRTLFLERDGFDV